MRAGGLIVSGESAAACSSGRPWLQTRTARSLRAAETPLEIVAVTESGWLEEAVKFGGGVVVVSAGSWFAEPGVAAVPAASATGRPVVAFGLDIIEEAQARDCSWRTRSEQSGGDLSGKDARFWLAWGRPPALALDSRAVRALEAGMDWPSLLAAARVVHLSTLDVLRDSGKQPRIAQVITSLQFGGAERMALDLHRGLAASGTAATLLVLGRPGRQAFALPEGGVDLSEVPMNPEHRAAAVLAAAERFGADLIHAHLLGAAEIKALRPGGIPLMLTLHNTSQGWPADLPGLLEGDVRLLAACSLGVQADARRLLPRVPVRTAWNGIDFGRFRRTPETAARGQVLRHSLGLEPSDLLLLALANPRPQKRLDRLPPVVAELMKACPERKIRLVLAGQAAAFNPEAAACVEAVRTAAAACGVEAAVIFHGPAEDVPGLLAAADVLISAAAHEGLSLAHLEALAMEVPVVALAAGGTGEVAAAAGSAMTGLPQSATEREIAEAVLKATGWPAAAMEGGFHSSSAAGRDGARKCFSQESMTLRYSQLYGTALLAPCGPGKTVWLVTNNFTIGGAQSSARRLLAFWRGRGIAVRVAVLQENAAEPTPGLAALRREGFQVTVLPPLGPHEAWETLEPLWPELADDPPLAVLFWNAVTSCKRLIADGLPRTPVFDVSPGGMFFESLHPSFDRLRPDVPALSPADYGAQLSGAAVKYAREKERAEDVLGLAVHVIPNGVLLPETVAPFREHPACFVLGTAARLHPQKRLEDLLEAFRLALPDLPPCELRIAGEVDGGEVAYVEQLKRMAAGLPVRWSGAVEPVSRFYAELDVMVMISEPAGCPNASLEALAAGLPVIATDFGGASEQVISGVTGLLVPPRDNAALAAAVVRMALDKQLRRICAENARPHIERHFTVPRMARQYARMIGLEAGDNEDTGDPGDDPCPDKAGIKSAAPGVLSS